MSKQELIDFVELVQADPKWKDQADMVLLKNRYALSTRDTDEQLIWYVMDEFKNIFLNSDEYCPVTRSDAESLIDIVKLYLD
jgi:hypothetical protein